MLYPLKFSHVYKERIWGGDKLKSKYKRDIYADNIGESWEVACHKEGMSIIENGEYKGKSLQYIFDYYGEELMGSKYFECDRFPLLVKLIDAKERLSLQVHPNDPYANLLERGEYGKSEMWYVLNAKPDAKLIIGLKDGVSRDDFLNGLMNNDIKPYLNEVPVKAGDVFFIPAGLLHAITEEVMVAEIQQSSDTVYRVFDWNRLGLNGKPRELHLEKALGSIDFQHRIDKRKLQGLHVQETNKETTYLIADEHFAIEKIKLSGYSYDSTNKEKMMIILCLQGQLEITWNDETWNVEAGETILLPACMGEFELNGNSEFLKAYIPKIEDDIFKFFDEKGISRREVYARIAMG
jgi:mannose-6-phosphate isomerase